MYTYTLLKKSTGMYKHSSFKQFSADTDQAKVFTTLVGAKLSMGWSIYFDNTKVNEVKLSLIPQHIKDLYEIVEYKAKEVQRIQL